MTYPFSVIGIWRISQIPFIAVSLVFLVFSVMNGNIHGFLPSLVGVMLFSLFHSITRGSWVSLHNYGMEVRFGFVAHFHLPYDAIEKVEIVHQPLLYGLGVKLVKKDTLAFVTDKENVVEFKLHEVQSIKFSIIPIKLRVRAIRLSIQNSQAFLRDLRLHIS